MAEKHDLGARRAARARGGRARWCASCGEAPRGHGGPLTFCDDCLAWTRQRDLDEWDELGAGD